MDRNWRVAAASGLIGMLTSLAPVAAQQPGAAPSGAPATAATAKAPAATTAKQASTRQPGAEEVDVGQIELNGKHTVNLDREGIVHGRISLLDPRTGLPTPVDNAIVSFVQNGRLVTQVRPGSNGTFTVRLQPGVYSVIATAPAGYGAFAVLIRPYDPTATDPQELLLDGTLIPPADAAAAAIAPPGALPPGGPPFGGVGGGATRGGGGGFVGGGGGGTGGGLNSLLGLAPLAALAALAGDDDDDGAAITTPVSPVTP